MAPAAHPCPSIPPRDAAPYKSLCCLRSLLIKTKRSSQGLDRRKDPCFSQLWGKRGGGKREIPKLSHHTFFSLSRFCSTSGMAEGARACLFTAVCFQPIKALTRWIFFHFHRALHTDAESSGKRSCQGTLSRGADVSGENKVETMREKEER